MIRQGAWVSTVKKLQGNRDDEAGGGVVIAGVAETYSAWLATRGFALQDQQFVAVFGLEVFKLLG